MGVDVGKAEKRARFISDLLDSVKSRLIPADAARKQIADLRHISIHVAAFGRHLRSGGAKEEHVAKTLYRLNVMLDLMSATKLQHITGPMAEKAMITLRTQRRLDRKGKPTDQTLSVQTANYYLRSIKQFIRWGAGKARLYATDPLAHMELPTTKGTGNIRRDITLPELAYLVDWLAGRPRRIAGGADGNERAMIYLVATSTGYRANELRQAKADWVRFDAPPALVVPEEFTKNKKGAVQPIPAWLAAMLQAWMGDRRTGPLFAHARDGAGLHARARTARRPRRVDRRGHHDAGDQGPPRLHVPATQERRGAD